MKNSMDTVKKMIIILYTIFAFSLQSTIVVTVSNCHILSECTGGSKCQNVCQFSGINTIGDIIKLPVGSEVFKQILGTINFVSQTSVQFQKKNWQTAVEYIPTQGHLKQKIISLLFYNVDIQNIAYVEMLPKKLRESIKKYQIKDPNIRYALFILKRVRDNIWQEISETYLAQKSPDTVAIPINIYPDGNIQITVPDGNTAEGIMYYIRIDQMS